VFSFFNKKKILGLDIGTSTIKLVELDRTKKGASLVSFAIAPTPPQSFASGEILDTQAIGNSVKDLLNKTGTKRQHLAVGLGGASVIVKRITIPRMERELVSEQIRWEAEQYIPYDINEVNLGFEILRTGSSAENMDLLLIAAISSHVFKYAEAAQICGLQCEVVDVNGFALANCFKENYGSMDGQTIGLLNMGATATNVAVIENGEVVFCRDIPVGGLTYTQDLQKALSVSLEEAESMKLSVAAGQAPTEAEAAIKGTHEMVVEEVRGSLDFFQNTNRNKGIQRIFVSGGGSKTPGFIEGLKALGKIDRLDPFFSVEVDKRKFSADYINQIRDLSAIAMGLGFRQVGDA
jgi:type IV pilus assembly protein PilM